MPTDTIMIFTIKQLKLLHSESLDKTLQAVSKLAEIKKLLGRHCPLHQIGEMQDIIKSLVSECFIRGNYDSLDEYLAFFKKEYQSLHMTRI
jgi:hypothetical protein